MIKTSDSSEETATNSEKWMPCPKIICKFPGLAYIYQINQLIIAKKTDKLHALIEEHDVSYTIYNILGEKVFIGVQKNKATQFQIKLYNIYGNEVMYMTKYWKCFVHRVFVWAPPGNFVGSVQRSSFANKYEVKDREDGDVLIMKVYQQDAMFSVLIDGVEVGTVMRGSPLPLPFENYVVSFPDNLEVGLKAVLLSACFLMMQKL